jgi:hypothetical protein
MNSYEQTVKFSNTFYTFIERSLQALMHKTNQETNEDFSISDDVITYK